jgi:ABC-type molybdate transport system substrate-binding protein
LTVVDTGQESRIGEQCNRRTLRLWQWLSKGARSVADQAKAKSQVVAPGASVSMLAKDTSPGIVIALSVLTQIAGHPGAKLVGPLPKELQAPVTVFAALGAHPQDEAAAQAFLQDLASTEAKKAYVAIGFEVE